MLKSVKLAYSGDSLAIISVHCI